MGRKGLFVGCLVAMGIGLCAGRLPAADSNWIASAGDWSDANNWSGGEPNSATDAYITNGGAATITQGGEASRFLYVGNATGESGTVNMGSGSLDSNTQFVGNAGTGTIVQTDGNNRVSGSLYLGYAPGSSGTYLLSGKGRLLAWSRAGSEYIGYSGTGTFQHTDGNNTFSNGLYLGCFPGSSGTYQLSGNARLMAYGRGDSNEFVGYAGSGKFVQSGGTNMRLPEAFDLSFPSVTLGYLPDSNGTYELSGKGFLKAERTNVGYSGAGVFTLTDANHFAGYFYLGYAPGSTGTYQMVGRSYLWASDEYVGYSGTGAFIQSDGNHYVLARLYLGYNPGSSGTYQLSGNALLEQNVSIPIMPLPYAECIGYSGTGAFLQTGGRNVGVVVLGANAGSSGTYQLDSGFLGAGIYVGYSGTGLFTQNDGNVYGAPILGALAGSSGTYVLNYGRLTNFGDEYVGQYGTGVFVHKDGNHTVGIPGPGQSSLRLGFESSGSGTYQLIGPGRLYVKTAEYIGMRGPGLFVHSDGNNVTPGTLYVAFGVGQGTYQLSGRGRLWAGSEYVRGAPGMFQSGGQNITGYLSISGSGRYQLTDGNVRVTGIIDDSALLDLSVGTGTLATIGPVKITGTGRFDLGGGTLAHTDANLYVKIQNDGNFRVTSAGHQVDSVIPLDPNLLRGFTQVDPSAWLIAKAVEQQTLRVDGSLTVSGPLTAGQLYVGSGGGGGVNITDPNASITISGLLSIGAGGSLSAPPGSTIHMTGSVFENKSADPNALSCLNSLTMIFEGADANSDPFEVGGLDLGATAGGFVGNFGLGTLELGGSAGAGRVMLVDLFDNRTDSNAPEALYVQNLIVNPGSELWLNGLHLYVNGGLVNPGDGGLYGGGDIFVPEPAAICLLAAGAVAILRRRRG